MAPEPDERTALFERIISTGTRRRRQRFAAFGGVALSVVVVVVAFVVGSSSGRDNVRTADEPTTSTSTSDASTTSTVTALESTTTSAVTGTTSQAEGATTSSSTTVNLPVCRDSYDPRCGPFYWDYDPATWANAVLELTISHEPVTIIAGQDVTFTMTFYDPDHDWPDNCASGTMAGATPVDDTAMRFLTPDGSVHFPCAVAGCVIDERAGPWDPPPPPDPVPEPTAQSLTVRYDQAGQYSITVDARPSVFCDEFPGYLSPSSVTITVDVVPYE